MGLSPATLFRAKADASSTGRIIDQALLSVGTSSLRGWTSRLRLGRDGGDAGRVPWNGVTPQRQAGLGENAELLRGLPAVGWPAYGTGGVPARC